MRRALPFLSLLLLFGCTKPEKLTVAPEAALPQGWTFVNSAADGVSLGAPPGWRQGVPKGFSVASTLESMGGDSNSNPEAQNFANEMIQREQESEMRALQELRGKGMLCHCVNGNRPVIGETPTRFYVKVEKMDGPASLEAAVAMEKEKMLEEGAGKEVKLANGKAWRLASTIKTRGGDDLTKIAYILVHEDRRYVLRFTSTNDPVSVEQIEKQVADTLRIDPSKKPSFATEKED